MDSAVIGKIQKAKEYAEQPERMQFTAFSVRFDGENSPHTVNFTEGNWDCSCSFFAARGFCSHTMAIQRVVGKMLTAYSDEDDATPAAVEAALETES